jgi:hypothetical protein
MTKQEIEALKDDSEFCEHLKWFIVNRIADDDGPIRWKICPIEDLPPRPNWANPDNGDPYTPWKRTDDHVHLEDSVTVTGAHVQALDAEEAIELAKVTYRLYEARQKKRRFPPK